MSTTTTRHGWILGLTCVGILASAGCGIRPWTVVRQAMPNPLVGQVVVIEPVRYDALIVGDRPEPAYQATKDPQQQQSWQIDKAETAQIIVGEVLSGTAGRVQPAPGPPGAFRAVINVHFFEPGFYAVVAARNTELGMSLRLLAPSGALVDEIHTQASVHARLENPSSGGRMREAGHAVGRIAAWYLRERLAGQQ